MPFAISVPTFGFNALSKGLINKKSTLTVKPGKIVGANDKADHCNDSEVLYLLDNVYFLFFPSLAMMTTDKSRGSNQLPDICSDSSSEKSRLGLPATPLVS